MDMFVYLSICLLAIINQSQTYGVYVHQCQTFVCLFLCITSHCLDLFIDRPYLFIFIFVFYAD